jgi:hypothetical protein
VTDGEGVRIAMWSGPRNISTAMMRSFEARGDSAVTDEPFYAAYLHRTGIRHPMREAVIASQSIVPRDVAAMLVGPVPGGKPVWYQKHMTLHLLDDFDRGWLTRVRNAFLIREPRAVLASYASKRADVNLADIGFVQQRELFDAVADRAGRAPPVVDAADILANPAATLEKLCAALDVPYTAAMLRWPAGRRPTDGVWAPAWYQAVERSTGFGDTTGGAAVDPAAAAGPAAAGVDSARLAPHLAELAAQAEPHYAALWRHRLF